jgi:two-component system response regulator YesN
VEQAENIYNELHAKIIGNMNLLKEDVIVFYNQFFTMLLLMLKEMDMSIIQFSEGNMNPYTRILHHDSVSTINKNIWEVLRKIAIEVRSKRDLQHQGLVNDAKEFMKRNYVDSDLSVKKIAQHVGVSTSYFSALFKEKENRTIQEYLINLRINKAKELIKTTDYKSYEIAREVGYSDPHYFASAFKRQIGITTTEYRKIHFEQ